MLDASLACYWCNGMIAHTFEDVPDEISKLEYTRNDEQNRENARVGLAIRVRKGLRGRDSLVHHFILE